MRIGIYGGTFDPVHLGHLILAETCRQACGLDEVWFVPAALPPHKQGQTITSSKDRTRMLEFAIAGHAQFKVNTLELKREGPSFTVDTLAEIQAKDSARELFLLLGSDSLADFPTWYRPERILELATLVAVNRGRATCSLAEVQRLGPAGLARVMSVVMPAVEISATQLRRQVAQGLSIRYQTPRAVELYILEHRLYQASDDVSA